jgi:hypothetical protein
MKILPVEPNSSMRTDGRADGQTKMTNIIVAFRTFAKAPKILLNLLMMSTQIDGNV